MRTRLLVLFASASLLNGGCALMRTTGPSGEPKPVGRWEAVVCPPADREPAERFEAVRAIDDFESGLGDWKASNGGQNAKARLAIDTQEKHAGSAALRVDYEFVGNPDLEYVEFGRPIEVKQRGLGVGFWVKSDGTGLPLRIRIRDRSGETRQVNVARLDFEGWRYVACGFDFAGESWGGDGNRRLDYPCVFHSILADRPRRGHKGKGSLWVDGVQLVRPRKAAEALTLEALGKRLGNVYEPGDTVRLRASGPGESIRWRVDDYWGRKLAFGQGPAAATSIEFSLPQAGHYACTLERLEGERVAEARVFRCAALPPADPESRNTFVGVCSHYGQRAYPLASMELLVRLGIREIRDEISWGAVERQKGQLALPDFAEKYTARARQLGIRPLIIFDYANRFYDSGGYPLSPEAVGGYARYSAALAGWLRGRVDAFEVWNEYSGGCGMGGKTGKQTPATYARMLQATHRAVKQVAPDVTLVGIGGDHSSHHLDKIEGMFQAGIAKAMDAFSVHSYRYPASPESTDLVGEILHVAELARRYGAAPRIWITEIGWPTHIGPRGVDEPTQARYIVRTMALLQATRVVEKVHWYDFKNDGLSRDYNEHNFGVVWHQKFNYAPKPAAVALSVFARMTAGATVQRLWHEGERYAVLYERPDGRELAVAWATGGAHPLPVSARRLRAFDILGNPVPDPRRLTLTDSPVYLVGRALRIVGKETSR